MRLLWRSQRQRGILVAMAVAFMAGLAGCGPTSSTVDPPVPAADPIQAENARLKQQVAELQKRLSALEPDTPVTRPLSDIDREVEIFTATHPITPVDQVMRRGARLPFDAVVTNTQWRRPGYSGVWHSTYFGGKYSGVEKLVELAAHRAFVYTGGLAASQQLLYGLGIVTTPESDATRGKNLPLQDTRGDHISLLILYGQVQSVTRLDKQVVVKVKPTEAGFQEVRLNTVDVLGKTGTSGGDSGTSTVLFEFVTPEGDPLDAYTADLTGLRKG
ncbi:hypothetical protein [Kyrpidia sp.]|uniref:hypothetical protein n=1 Tax=Kyrpidia sp. TaxID=2073077 RepID=UPI00182FCCB9|nr:hypothetical protein [Kyrpidia sp.]MCL6574860.1 hypothetical protein [Kyrpidia sp.]HHY68500.1 hypothetical protein [Alicyclobacillus sp.]